MSPQMLIRFISVIILILKTMLTVKLFFLGVNFHFVHLFRPIKEEESLSHFHKLTWKRHAFIMKYMQTRSGD